MCIQKSLLDFLVTFGGCIVYIKLIFHHKLFDGCFFT